MIDNCDVSFVVHSFFYFRYIARHQRVLMITALTLENMMESKDSCVFSRFNLSKVIFSTLSKGSIKVLAVEPDRPHRQFRCFNFTHFVIRIFKSEVHSLQKISSTVVRREKAGRENSGSPTSIKFGDKNKQNLQKPNDFKIWLYGFKPAPSKHFSRYSLNIKYLYNMLHLH